MRSLLLLGGLLVLGLPAVALRLAPLPEVVAQPASGPDLDQTALENLSFILSGVPAESVPAYRQTIEGWSTEFRSHLSPSWDEAHRAEGLLQFLHTHMKSYATFQTRLDVLLDRGTFNCVSSALAYMILGRSVGLDVQAVATTDHAFALVRLATGRQVDVETTTKFGFDPGTKTEFTNSFGQTGFAYVPPGNYAQRRSIGDRQLLGLLVQNRMADDQRSNQPEDAVGLGIDRWTLEGTPEAFRTLIDGFVNYGADLNARRQYAQGLDLVDQMVRWTGPVPEAKQMAFAFLNNDVNQFLDREDWAGAQTLTQTWKEKGLITDAQADQTVSLIKDRQLSVAVKTLPLDQAAQQVDSAFGQGTVTPARRQELLTYLYGQEVQRIAKAQGPRAAWTYLGQLSPEVQGLPALARARTVYAYNWSVAVHNQFAELWNANRKDEARKILQDSLAALPDSALLRKDLVVSQGD